MIFLEGGGACYTQESCIQRSKNHLGSSNYWPKTFNSQNTILSNDPITNPDFYSGHHVYAPYCNGDVWSGQRSVSSKNPDTWGFIFGGHLVFESIINYLAYDMKTASILDAQYILLLGTSAGGIGTFGNINWLYNQYKQVGKYADNVTIKAAPIGGWFLPGIHVYIHL